MTPPLEHDYIGLSETPAMGASEKLFPPAAGDEDGLGTLRETELRLGLPGSGTPGRKEKEKDKDKALLSLGLPKGFVSGSKRGFTDAIDGARNWAFSGGIGSEVELAKGLLTPGGDGGQKTISAGSYVKDAGLASKGAAPEKKSQVPAGGTDRGAAPAAKAQVVGWPPIRSYRKNTMAANPPKTSDDPEGKQGSGCLYVKVSMDGAPYLRKVDLKMYDKYKELSSALENMFSCFTLGQCGANGVPGRDGLSESCLRDLVHGSECVLTYEDKDGDWMLVGDVPWDMFIDSCRRLRIMKGSDAIGLAPRAMEKNKNRN